MTTRRRFAHTPLALVASAALAFGPLSWDGAHAKPVAWTGQGTSAFWSDALNWSPQGAPADGDDLLFGGAPTRTGSVFDLTRSFSSLTFSADAPLFVMHVQGHGAQLAFSGLGIFAFDRVVGTAIGYQTFIADAGSTGGTVLFANSSGVNLGSGEFARAIDITARGGATAGAIGGHLVFQDSSSTGGSTFDVLRADGASVAGAIGGEIVFRDAASGTRLTSVVLGGGTSAAASGGRASFQARAQNAGGVAVQAGQSGGLGGRVDIGDNAVFLSTSSVYGEGGTAALAGSEAVVSFRGEARFMGSAYLNAGNVAGANGGRIDFFERASHDTSGFAPGSGRLGIYNVGAVVSGASGGALVFHDNAIIRGAHLFIANQTAEFLAPSAGAGSTSFLDRSRAGQVAIDNAGSGGAGATGGATYFRNLASAENATITSLGGFAHGGSGGRTLFSDSASAGSASLHNAGGRAVGAGGGLTQFLDRSTAADATLVMAGGGVSGALGGATVFFADASAGNAMLDVRGATVAGAAGGSVRFAGQASAGRATVTVQGAQANSIDGPEGGVVSFTFDASAGQAHFSIGGNLTDFGSPGRVQFSDASTAADASFTTLAGANTGGRLTFTGTAVQTASAGHSSINNGSRLPGSVSTGNDFGGATLFLAHSSADRAAITNAAGATAFGAQTVFRADSTAADAVIVNAGGRAGDRGGITFFQDTASAGRAVITNRAGALNATGMTLFDGTASATQATLTAGGASSPGDVGGRVLFTALSTAAQSTLVADGGSAGGLGGRLSFSGQATGSTARVVLHAGSGAGTDGTLDLSGVNVWLQVGSIEGGGNVSLGAKSLIVVGNGRATTFSGVIGGSVPAVFPSLSVLGGTLTLTGANTYAGRTQIGDGLNVGSGKLVAANTSGSATGSGGVRVERGGTLAGSGFIAGPVTLRDGGILAPGDPVTLTLQSSLTWDGGGLIRLVLGADDAGSDHIVVDSLLRGAGGPFAFELIDAGTVGGTRYTLLQFNSLVGFVASDFTLWGAGAAGRFSIVDGAIGFTSAVPEPRSAALLMLGLFSIAWCVRGTRAQPALGMH